MCRLSFCERLFTRPFLASTKTAWAPAAMTCSAKNAGASAGSWIIDADQPVRTGNKPRQSIASIVIPPVFGHFRAVNCRPVSTKRMMPISSARSVRMADKLKLGRRTPTHERVPAPRSAVAPLSAAPKPRRELSDRGIRVHGDVARVLNRDAGRRSRPDSRKQSPKSARLAVDGNVANASTPVEMAFLVGQNRGRNHLPTINFQLEARSWRADSMGDDFDRTYSLPNPCNLQVDVSRIGIAERRRHRGGARRPGRPRGSRQRDSEGCGQTEVNRIHCFSLRIASDLVNMAGPVGAACADAACGADGRQLIRYTTGQLTMKPTGRNAPLSIPVMKPRVAMSSIAKASVSRER